jgi:hypothetical protein
MYSFKSSLCCHQRRPLPVPLRIEDVVLAAAFSVCRRYELESEVIWSGA